MPQRAHSYPQTPQRDDDFLSRLRRQHPEARKVAARFFALSLTGVVAGVWLVTRLSGIQSVNLSSVVSAPSGQDQTAAAVFSEPVGNISDLWQRMLSVRVTKEGAAEEVPSKEEPGRGDTPDPAPREWTVPAAQDESY
ncbi:MAG: hypothetical protein KatS3mg100_592 [Candidatus Parcubacteria bacterium]|nr:MAG: hypothetical protein KatS3mg100_592 [Candidatus Parcubacteria bacterium]